MKLPTIDINNVSYLSLQGLCWLADGLHSHRSLKSSGGELLCQHLTKAASGSTLLIDCRRVKYIGDRALQAAVEWARGEKRRRAAVFIARPELERTLAAATGSSAVDVRLADGRRLLVLGRPSEPEEALVELAEAFESTRDAFVKSAIVESYHPWPDGTKRLASTPLLANGVFDARLILEDRRKFMWVCIALAERLRRKLQTEEEMRSSGGESLGIVGRDWRLMGVSLRASPFAVSVAGLLDLMSRVEIVDHMGPKHRIIEEHSLKSRPFRGDYVLVSDFVVGGTELRTAQSYAFHRGARLQHVLAIGAALPGGAYDGDLDLTSLADLSLCFPISERLPLLEERRCTTA